MSINPEHLPDAWRRRTAIACAITSAIALLAAMGFAADMASRHSIGVEGKPLWFGTLIVAALGLIAAYVACQVAHSQPFLPRWVQRSPLTSVYFLLGLAVLSMWLSGRHRLALLYV